MYLHEALGVNPYQVKVRKSWWPKGTTAPTEGSRDWTHYVYWDGMWPDPIGPTWIQTGGPTGTKHVYPMTPVDLVSNDWEPL